MRMLQQMHGAVAFPNKKFVTLSAALMMLLGGAAMADTTVAAQAMQARATYSFDIPAQSLNDALQALALTSRHKLLCSAELVQGRSSPALKGEFTTEQAVRQLLAGTDLVYEVDNGLVLIRARNAKLPVSEVMEKKSGVMLLADGSEARGSAEDNRAMQKVNSDSSDNHSSQGIQEVVVTAQKRGEQRLLDVPISISVLGGDALDSTTSESLNDVISQIPGVSSFDSSQNGGTKFAVRGVTSNPSTTSGSSTVAYYLDEVPFAFGRIPVTPDANAYDMERVEVLRGPQGTLYGASSLNGVIRVMTKDANLDKFELKARASTSNTEEGGWNYRGDMALNVPIIPGKLAGRAVVGYQDLSGWIERPATGDTDINDAEIRTLRLKMNAKPVEHMSAEFVAWFSRDDRGAPSGSLDDFTNPLGIDEPFSVDYDTYGLTIGYDFPSISVISATSYIDYESIGLLDAFGLDVLTTTIAAELFTQEVRLHSTYEGPWQWSLGGMYRDSQDRFTSILPVFFVIPSDRYWGSESYALFGELTYGFADGWFDVTAGLRYFEDDTSVESIRIPGVAPGDLLRSKTTFDTLTPRAVLSWHPRENLTVYGSYSQGFRSGFGLDQSVLRVNPDLKPVKEDTLANYEIGAKGRAMDGRLTYETAVYYIDWKDTQQLLFVPIAANVCCQSTQLNGEDISGMGVDVGMQMELMTGLAVGLSASWNDLAFDAQVRHPNGTVLFHEGERPDESPKTTLGATLDYNAPIGESGFEARFSTAASYTSGTTNHALGSRTVATGDSFLNIGLRVSLLSPDNWIATMFVDNLANEYPVLSTNTNNDSRFLTRPRPRTVGLQIEYRF